MLNLSGLKKEFTGSADQKIYVLNCFKIKFLRYEELSKHIFALCYENNNLILNLGWQTTNQNTPKRTLNDYIERLSAIFHNIRFVNVRQRKLFKFSNTAPLKFTLTATRQKIL